MTKVPVSKKLTPKQKLIYNKMKPDVWHTDFTLGQMLRKPEAELRNTLVSMKRKGYLETYTSHSVKFFKKVIK